MLLLKDVYRGEVWGMMVSGEQMLALSQLQWNSKTLEEMGGLIILCIISQRRLWMMLSSPAFLTGLIVFMQGLK